MKKPIYTLDHGVEVIGEYPITLKNPYARLRIRPHPFFPGAAETSNGILVRKNRVILAVKLGRALTRKELAHHRDENKRNDSPENIEIQSATEHNRHHKTGSRHREESKMKTSASLKVAYSEGRHAPPFIREQRGDLNASAKLTWEKVRQIRADAGTHQEIADRYGVSRRNIGMIKKGVTWK